MPAKKTQTISENAFAGQATRPSERELASVLGGSHSLWQNLAADLKRDLKLDGAEWNSYSVKAGWSLRLQSKKRNIVYFGPRAGYFLASFILGEKAVAAARKSKLPAQILKMIDEAKRYPEGTAVRLEVHAPADADIVKTLAKIKFEN
jgi:Protein of unknown function (DUF3788)